MHVVYMYKYTSTASTYTSTNTAGTYILQKYIRFKPLILSSQLSEDV